VHLVDDGSTVRGEHGCGTVGRGAEGERVDLGTEGACRRERLERGRRQVPPVVFDDDEHAHFSNPSSSRRSTTAGAASGPVPRIVVSLTCSAADSRVTIC
jgi:hypothetical protein